MDQQKPNNVTTVLGDDVLFTGKIESRGALRIDGRVEGEIFAQDSVIVGPSGVVKANVNAASISISGQVDGSIVATKKIELHPTAVIKGDIKTAIGALTIEAGARIDGRCTMTEEKIDSRTARRRRRRGSFAARSFPAVKARGSAQARGADGAADFGAASGGSREEMKFRAARAGGACRDATSALRM